MTQDSRKRQKPTDPTPTKTTTLPPSLSSPTIQPTFSPTLTPTFSSPTVSPSFWPTVSPNFWPSVSPTLSPTFSPTLSPTFSPTFSPTIAISPTVAPTIRHMPTWTSTTSPSTTSPTGQPTSLNASSGGALVLHPGVVALIAICIICLTIFGVAWICRRSRGQTDGTTGINPVFRVASVHRTNPVANANEDISLGHPSSVEGSADIDPDSSANEVRQLSSRQADDDFYDALGTGNNGHGAIDADPARLPGHTYEYDRNDAVHVEVLDENGNVVGPIAIGHVEPVYLELGNGVSVASAYAQARQPILPR